MWSLFQQIVLVPRLPRLSVSALCRPLAQHTVDLWKDLHWCVDLEISAKKRKTNDVCFDAFSSRGVTEIPSGVANGLCETLRDGETSVFLCEPEPFIYFEMRVRDFRAIVETRVRDLCS